MIKLFFVCGSAIRQVYIDGRVISMMSQEVGGVPIKMDLDKIDEKQIKNKMGSEGLKIIKEIALLNTEIEMAEDIKKDFQRTGWRLCKREGWH